MSFIFLYGRPGSGKTTLAASMTNLGYKVRFIDLDNKVQQMHNLQHLLKEDKIRVTTLSSSFLESTMKDLILHPKVAVLKQPQGYLEICDIITNYEEMAAQDPPLMPEEEVLAFDGITSMQEHMKRLINHIQGKPNFTYDEWAITLSNFENFFYTMQSLQKIFKHVIVIAHEMTERDEIEGKVETLPLIEGQTRHKAGKFFEEVYYCVCEVPKSGSPIYKVMTVASERYTARTSREVNTYEIADFGILFQDELPPELRGKVKKKGLTVVEQKLIEAREKALKERQEA